jgi:hypothetical protein
VAAVHQREQRAKVPSRVFPYPQRFRVECETAGCKNTVPPDVSKCGACRARDDQERLALEHVLQDFRRRELPQLEHLLGRYAEFERRYGPE